MEVVAAFSPSNVLHCQFQTPKSVHLKFSNMDVINFFFGLFLTVFIFFETHCSDVQLIHSANLFTAVAVI